MEFSLRTIRQYHKLIKSKRSINHPEVLELQNDAQISNSQLESLIYFPETRQLKSYQDGHLFKMNMASIQTSAELSKRSTFSRQKTEMESYEPLSKRRDTKRLNNMSYQLQKTQRSEKTRKALEDLKKIGEISINHFQGNSETAVRINKDHEKNNEEQPFRRWRTLTREKSRSQKSPMKGKISVGKRAKNSPIKTTLNLRIRTTYFNKSKTSQFGINLSTMQSSSGSIQNSQPAPRKSSIAPWETEEQGLN